MKKKNENKENKEWIPNIFLHLYYIVLLDLKKKFGSKMYLKCSYFKSESL
jgi:hypothetical protein